ncbi:MAG: type IV pilus twitching motility protein PilT [Myxococcales bacterium]|nr:type IV pilus twitching motility protein PilT [Myxococcales bacterium]
MSLPLDQVLQTARQLGSSDIHLKVGLPPVFRIKGDLRTVRDVAGLTNEMITGFATRMMNDRMRELFERDKDVDLAYTDERGGRYRVNIYQQRGCVGIALRVVPNELPTFERLNLPDVVLKLADEPRGLILVTGATGSGKSTTLAAMIDYINSRRAAHIMTIEDPVEYLHKDRLSIVNQRELELDTTSFARALRASLRQDPDVILVGEMRDLETIETALSAAETGHLVMSTLHTVDAVETINRIVVAFPTHQHTQVRIQLASILKGVISQRLIPRADGKGMVPAIEVMVSTQRIRELIENPSRTREIADCIASGRHPYGMFSFDQCLADLVQRRLVTYEEALANASKPDDFALTFRGFGTGPMVK